MCVLEVTTGRGSLVVLDNGEIIIAVVHHELMKVIAWWDYLFLSLSSKVSSSYFLPLSFLLLFLAPLSNPPSCCPHIFLLFTSH